jgi:hypothetical protein
VDAYPPLRTARCILGLARDLAFQVLHGLYIRWHRSMDKYRNSKLALGKLVRLSVIAASLINI